ncbi:hypothetical protein HPB48_021693 [Haemaphysalis longicornis]|uniref:cystathionine gamma-lyase n=1 Tax=Haemaphysalis longicornis TaxID=44386 RepID=A0A9J6FTE9_HAELO|nr:hypothetical protein HPB48_021693 [Haemaphysalis longicornis]
MKVVDIKAVCEIVHKKCEAIVAVDNTFMSSYFQKPLLLGADISVHSLTKYMNAAGAVPSPFDCFLVNRGLKTLHVRMERHMENGLKVARFLEAHPLVDKVMHPGLPSHPQHDVAQRQCSGFSGMVTFRLKGGLKESTLFLKNLKIVTLADSLGSTESLAELPAVMTHAALPEEQRRLLGITDNLIRLSVGLENSDDLIRDIDQALNKAVRLGGPHVKSHDIGATFSAHVVNSLTIINEYAAVYFEYKFSPCPAEFQSREMQVKVEVPPST